MLLLFSMYNLLVGLGIGTFEVPIEINQHQVLLKCLLSNDACNHPELEIMTICLTCSQPINANVPWFDLIGIKWSNQVVSVLLGTGIVIFLNDLYTFLMDCCVTG